MNLYILLLAVITLNGFYNLFNNKSGIFGCGLIAFCPNDGQKANIAYMQLIATFNATRGTDSCGIYMNNTIKKGVGLESDIRDYMINNKVAYAPNCKNKSIIAHARKSTKGLSNFENAHPFEILSEDKTSKLVGAHNGTLTNCFELAKRYDVPFVYGDVDSKFIFTVIQKTKSYDILSRYEGAAALVMAYEEEPNTLYVFKGASREYRTSKELSDERPLYLLTRTEGIYISSMIEPLKIIANGDTSIKIQTFCENMVIKIKDNKLTRVETIDREWVNEPIVYTPAVAATSNYKENKTYFSSLKTETGTEAKEDKKSDVLNKRYPRTNSEMYNEVVYCTSGNIILDNFVYYIGGRYLNMDSLKNYVTRRNMPSSILLKEELESYYLDGWKTIVKTESGDYKISNTKVAQNKDMQYRLFYKGVLIEKSKETNFINNNQVNRLNSMSNLTEKCKQLSSFSETPILPTLEEKNNITPAVEPQYFYRGNIYRGTMDFIPEFSHRLYDFKDGYIVGISAYEVNDAIFKEKEEEKSTKSYEKTITTLSDGSYLFRTVSNVPEYEQIVTRRESENVLDSVEMYRLEVCGLNYNQDYVGKDLIENVLTEIFTDYIRNNSLDVADAKKVGTKEERAELEEKLLSELIKSCLSHDLGISDYLTAKIGVDEFEQYLDSYLCDEVEDFVDSYQTYLLEKDKK